MKQGNDIKYELDFFAGAGGGILGAMLGGVQCICAVEWEAYPAGVLAARQNEGILPPFPIWCDVRSFTKRNNSCRRFIRSLRAIRHRLRIAGGFPCQDISAAGKGAGLEGERSGMWFYLARAIGEIRPGEVLLENSPMLVGRGLVRVVSDLAALGYDARWGVLGAEDAIWNQGAPALDHERHRLWLVARPNSTFERCREARRVRHHEYSERSPGLCQKGADSECAGLEGLRGRTGKSEVAESRNGGASNADTLCERCRQVESQDGRGEKRVRESNKARECAFTGGATCWWKAEPGVGRVVDGVAARVDRIRAIGNGQVPDVVELAEWEIGSEW